jgi:16S rRNA (adenine1518-N6/adenine1519-N6)-dimethyltransferase
VLMLQKEAADRYCAQPKTKAFGAISIFLQSAYTVRSTHNVSANCFFPKPKIDSTLICLDLKEDPICFSKEARAFIRRIFTQRRKQIQSLCKKDSYEGALEWLAFLKDQSFSENIRAEEITLSSWQKLGYKLHHEN